MKALTENRTYALCLLLALAGVAIRVPQIQAGEWPAHYQETRMEDEAFIAAMQRRLPEVPRPEIKKDNEDIEEIAASAREAEDSGRMPRMDYGRAVKGGTR